MQIIALAEGTALYIQSCRAKVSRARKRDKIERVAEERREGEERSDTN